MTYLEELKHFIKTHSIVSSTDNILSDIIEKINHEGDDNIGSWSAVFFEEANNYLKKNKIKLL